MSQLADVNIQSSVGMFSFCYVLHYFECILYKYDDDDDDVYTQVSLHI